MKQEAHWLKTMGGSQWTYLVWCRFVDSRDTYGNSIAPLGFGKGILAVIIGHMFME